MAPPAAPGGAPSPPPLLRPGAPGILRPAGSPAPAPPQQAQPQRPAPPSRPVGPAPAPPLLRPQGVPPPPPPSQQHPLRPMPPRPAPAPAPAPLRPAPSQAGVATPPPPPPPPPPTFNRPPLNAPQPLRPAGPPPPTANRPSAPQQAPMLRPQVPILNGTGSSSAPPQRPLPPSSDSSDMTLHRPQPPSLRVLEPLMPPPLNPDAPRRARDTVQIQDEDGDTYKDEEDSKVRVLCFLWSAVQSVHSARLRVSTCAFVRLFILSHSLPSLLVRRSSLMYKMALPDCFSECTPCAWQAKCVNSISRNSHRKTLMLTN